METRIQKWGNSLAVRIPKPIAAQLGLANHSSVKFSLRGMELVHSGKKPRFEASDLLAGVTRITCTGKATSARR